MARTFRRQHVDTETVNPKVPAYKLRNQRHQDRWQRNRKLPRLRSALSKCGSKYALLKYRGNPIEAIRARDAKEISRAAMIQDDF
jgi:hypothetical protein